MELKSRIEQQHGGLSIPARTLRAFGAEYPGLRAVCTSESVSQGFLN